MEVRIADVLSTTRRIHEAMAADDIGQCCKYLGKLNDQIAETNHNSSTHSDLSKNVANIQEKVKSRSNIDASAKLGLDIQSDLIDTVHRVEAFYLKRIDHCDTKDYDQQEISAELNKLQQRMEATETETAREILEIADKIKQRTDRTEEMSRKHRERMDSGPDVSDILNDES